MLNCFAYTRNNRYGFCNQNAVLGAFPFAKKAMDAVLCIYDLVSTLDFAGSDDDSKSAS